MIINMNDEIYLMLVSRNFIFEICNLVLYLDLYFKGLSG